MSSRRAAFVRRLGGPEEIEVGDLPVPVPAIGADVGLEEAARAHAAVEDGLRGKVVVSVGE